MKSSKVPAWKRDGRQIFIDRGASRFELSCRGWGGTDSAQSRQGLAIQCLFRVGKLDSALVWLKMATRWNEEIARRMPIWAPSYEWAVELTKAIKAMRRACALRLPLARLYYRLVIRYRDAGKTVQEQRKLRVYVSLSDS